MANVTITLRDRDEDLVTVNDADEWSSVEDMVNDMIIEFEDVGEITQSYFPYVVYSEIGDSRIALYEVDLRDIALAFMK